MSDRGDIGDDSFASIRKLGFICKMARQHVFQLHTLHATYRWLSMSRLCVMFAKALVNDPVAPAVAIVAMDAGGCPVILLDISVALTGINVCEKEERKRGVTGGRGTV